MEGCCGGFAAVSWGLDQRESCERDPRDPASPAGVSLRSPGLWGPPGRAVRLCPLCLCLSPVLSQMHLQGTEGGCLLLSGRLEADTGRDGPLQVSVDTPSTLTEGGADGDLVPVERWGEKRPVPSDDGSVEGSRGAAGVS